MTLVMSRIDVEKLLANQLATASPYLLRWLLPTFIRALIDAEADALGGAARRAIPTVAQSPQRL
jgi:hypothetical protein